MINVLGKIPSNVTLACSGGPDSMAILDFLRNGKKKVRIAHFDHGTSHGSLAREFISDFCSDKSIEIVIGALDEKKPERESWEAWWRDQRYRFFKSLDCTIVTGHHLNDVAEWWIFTSLHGVSKLIPYKNEKVIRPFLPTASSELISWCSRKNVKYVTDPGNSNVNFARSRIRHNIFEEALEINPGLLTVLRKKIKKDYNENYI